MRKTLILLGFLSACNNYTPYEKAPGPSTLPVGDLPDHVKFYDTDSCIDTARIQLEQAMIQWSALHVTFIHSIGTVDFVIQCWDQNDGNWIGWSDHGRIRVKKWAVDRNKDFLVELFMHELGHQMGLGHSTDPSAIMYPTLNNNSEWTDTDIEAYRTLLGLD